MSQLQGQNPRESANGGAYTVVHGRRSLQLATNRLVIPTKEVAAFMSAAHCAQALTSLLEHERTRVAAALEAAEEAGLEQGRQKAASEAAEAIAEAVARMGLELTAQRDAAREAVSTLALAVVSKISMTLGASQVVPSLIEQAVLEMMPVRAMRVRVHPVAVEGTRTRLAQLQLDAEVRSDESLRPFDCMVESADGQSVASLDTQLAALGKAIGVKASLDFELS